MPRHRPGPGRPLNRCEVCNHRYRHLATHLKIQCKVNQGTDRITRLGHDALARGLVPAGRGAALIGRLPPDVWAAIRRERIESSVDRTGSPFGENTWCDPWAAEVARMTHIDPKTRRWVIIRAAHSRAFRELVMESWLPAYWSTYRLTMDHKAAARMIKSWMCAEGLP